MATAKAIGAQTLGLHHLNLVFSRHGLQLSTNVEGVLLAVMQVGQLMPIS